MLERRLGDDLDRGRHGERSRRLVLLRLLCVRVAGCSTATSAGVGSPTACAAEAADAGSSSAEASPDVASAPDGAAGVSGSRSPPRRCRPQRPEAHPRSFRDRPLPTRPPRAEAGAAARRCRRAAEADAGARRTRDGRSLRRLDGRRLGLRRLGLRRLAFAAPLRGRRLAWSRGLPGSRGFLGRSGLRGRRLRSRRPRSLGCRRGAGRGRFLRRSGLLRRGRAGCRPSPRQRGRRSFAERAAWEPASAPRPSRLPLRRSRSPRSVGAVRGAWSPAACGAWAEATPRLRRSPTRPRYLRRTFRGAPAATLSSHQTTNPLRHRPTPGRAPHTLTDNRGTVDPRARHLIRTTAVLSGIPARIRTPHARPLA